MKKVFACVLLCTSASSSFGMEAEKLTITPREKKKKHIHMPCRVQDLVKNNLTKFILPRLHDSTGLMNGYKQTLVAINTYGLRSDYSDVKSVSSTIPAQSPVTTGLAQGHAAAQRLIKAHPDEYQAVKSALSAYLTLRERFEDACLAQLKAELEDEGCPIKFDKSVPKMLETNKELPMTDETLTQLSTMIGSYAYLEAQMENDFRKAHKKSVQKFVL